MEKQIVYQFLYNECIHESSAMTVSIHKTRKGAEMAMDFHKEQKRKEWDEMNKDRDPKDTFDYGKFGLMEWWGIGEIEILD